MKHLTKDQAQANERINAWLNDKPYREYPDQRYPRVPKLQPGTVLATYTPPNSEYWEQFFTPAHITAETIGPIAPALSPACRMLEPCAGIGHLIAPIFNGLKITDITAYEIEAQAHRIGGKLFPDLEWVNKNVFDDIDFLTGQFDFIPCNPPYGGGNHLKPQNDQHVGNAVWHSSKTEYLFLELAARSLRQGGHSVFITYGGFADRMPDTLRDYLNQIGFYQCRDPKSLGGGFLQTSVVAWAYYFRRES